MDKLITQRPEGMDFKTYQKIRKEQTNWLRRRKKTGDMVYVSSEIVTEETPTVKVEYRRTYPPAIKAYNKMVM